MMFTHLILVSVGLLLSVNGLAADSRQYWVIVSSSDSVTTVRRTDLSRMFLKRLTVWPDGHKALPIDQTGDSRARIAFSKEVLKKAVPAMKSFWQQKIFSGSDVPPPEMANDIDVIAYVKTHPGAVGYLGEAPREAGIRVVRVVD